MNRKEAWKQWLAGSKIKKKITERLEKLYPMEQSEVVFKRFWKKWLNYLAIIIAATLLLVLLLVVTNQEEKFLQDGNIIVRPEHNQEELEINIWAGVGGEEYADNITLQIAPIEYTLEEFEQLVEENIPFLEKAILGSNMSMEAITEDLNLADKLEDLPIEILWESDNEEVISREGLVNQEAVGEDGELVTLTAVFVYGEYKISHSFGMFVEPENLTEQIRLHRKLLTEIEKAFLISKNQSQVYLPEEIEGQVVFYGEEKKNNKSGAILFLGMGILLWVLLIKEELEREEKKREKQLLMDYPELISQFTLLLSAGMTVSGAWGRLVKQYESHQKEGVERRRYVYEEMTITWREMQNGISEAEAMKHFGNRIKLSPYLKFASLLSQNIRKGSRGLIELLKTEAGLAYEERKETAKQMGEEAGTKLLLPMLMMFGIVLIMILVPAFMSF